MTVLIVLQGASGSGKSTLARELAAQLNASIRSTDDQMMEDGVYTFRPEKLGKAHAENLRLAIEDMEAGRNVILDNTNTQRWEPREYIRAAVRLGYKIEFIRCTGRYENLHGVPADRVQAMWDRMEDLSIEGCLLDTRRL